MWCQEAWLPVKDDKSGEVALLNPLRDSLACVWHTPNLMITVALTVILLSPNSAVSYLEVPLVIQVLQSRLMERSS